MTGFFLTQQNEQEFSTFWWFAKGERFECICLGRFFFHFSSQIWQHCYWYAHNYKKKRLFDNLFLVKFRAHLNFGKLCIKSRSSKNYFLLICFLGRGGSDKFRKIRGESGDRRGEKIYIKSLFLYLLSTAAGTFNALNQFVCTKIYLWIFQVFFSQKKRGKSSPIFC